LIFNKAKEHSDVLFIDASREYEEGKRQNKLRESDLQKIVDTYRAFESREKYSHRATLDEIRSNDYNLNVPRSVNTFEEEEEIDVAAVQKEIEELETRLAEVRIEMRGYLKELGIEVEAVR
jgi:type I restriction enzyme M protein